jgi:predicted NBD/HSP70 family sugar kinase
MERMSPYKAGNSNNDLLVMNLIRRRGPISRNELAKLTTLTHPTITNITGKMIDAGMVMEYKIGESSGGRRPILLKMCPDYVQVVVINIRSNKLIGCLANADFTVKYEAVYDIRGLGQDEVIQVLLATIKECRTAAARPIAAVAVIVRGPVKSREGISVFSPNIGWRNVPLKFIVEEMFRVPVFVENDVRAMTMGEYYYGLAKDVNSMVLLKVGYGVGAGIVINGELYRGADDSAGEIGHTTIDLAGPQCPCGNYGCLEMLASETALVTTLIKAIREGQVSSVPDLVKENLHLVTADEIYQAADSGDELAVQTLKKGARYLGIGIVNVINTFNPEMIIIGGGISRGQQIIAETIRQTVRERAMENCYSSRKICFSDIGIESTLKGAVDMTLANVL